MKTILNRLINHETLTQQEAKQMLLGIAQNQYNSHQISAFLMVYLMRNITLNELMGFREALLEVCIPVDFSSYNAIDLCGTGGDGKNTFNISTLASFVVAGAGYAVAKHGNYGLSSVSGSSNVMEQLGVKFSNDTPFLQQCMEEANISILHAPLFHPALKNVATLRKDLGIKTFFNMLGPMVNPSFPKYQMVGVFNLELARLYAYMYQNTPTQFTIIHTLDGYDEVSLTAPTKVYSNTAERMITANDFGITELVESQIAGADTIENSAQLFYSIISGKGTEAQNDVVCANAAMAISTITAKPLTETFAQAQESLLQGKALEKLKKLQELSR